MKQKLILAALGCLAASAWADPYKVIVPLGAEMDGAMAYITNFDTGENVDSVLVADGAAHFEGQLDEPFFARILVDGNRYSQFIMESGTISFDERSHDAFGSQLNDELRALGDSVSVIASRFQTAPTDSAKQAVYADYRALMERKMKENIDNPIGYYLFIDAASELNADELADALTKYPAMAKYKRVAKLRELNERRRATSEGNKFTDFEIDGQKLSDYVGRDGHYLLVDFWASWCGPCMRQAEVIKDIYSQYKDKGLDVLGVAVWDKPDDTRRAIESHGLVWPCIVDAGTVPTDLYGISGIPCIMLIGPDGTILSRDKQGDELRAAVARYLDK